MTNETVIFQISGFLFRAIAWFLVGSALLFIDCVQLPYRNEVAITIWLSWTIGLAILACVPYVLSYRSICRWGHFFWLQQKFNYGK